MSLVLLLIYSAHLLFLEISYSYDKEEIRSKISINNCASTRIKFNDGSWSIKVNGHCEASRKYFLVNGAGSHEVNGLYESYGLETGISKYAKFLSNGTIFTIERKSLEKDANRYFWGIYRSDMALLYFAADSGFKAPPKWDWFAEAGSDPPPKISSYKLGKSRYADQYYNVIKSEAEISSYGDSINEYDYNNLTKDDATLKLMLHPSIGKKFGKFLHETYITASPHPAIALDGLLDYDLLRKSLAYEDIPLSEWVGPEKNLHCCDEKYRLEFNAWRANKWAKGLQAIISNPQFIGFLEELTGIKDLVPVKYNDREFVQLGSSMIAIGKGGYLHIHNDVSLLNTSLNLILKFKIKNYYIFLYKLLKHFYRN